MVYNRIYVIQIQSTYKASVSVPNMFPMDTIESHFFSEVPFSVVILGFLFDGSRSTANTSVSVSLIPSPPYAKGSVIVFSVEGINCES